MTSNNFLNFRLTGVYAFVLCLHYTLYGAFQTAPQIKTTYPGANAQVVKEVCQKVWWKNLLYIGIYDFGLDQSEYPKMGVSRCHIRSNIDGDYLVLRYGHILSDL